jgi:regulator of sirC expression with transglutaminase-like and TPR domain
MQDRITLPDWDALADLEDEALPLLPTALLIARDEYPDLQPSTYDALIQSHVDHLRSEVESIDNSPLKMAAINRHLFDELGYSGDHDEYYDPRNSYLNQVFERRLGNPISLALVQMEVARRLGIPLDGVSFPGHFLVRLPVDDGVLVMDPFNGGRPLDVDELRERAKSHLGGQMPDDQVLAQILDPAPARDPDAHAAQPAWRVRRGRRMGPRARSADRLLKLAPEQDDALRDRGLAYLQLEYLAGARHDLGQYLKRNPEASDAQWLREKLIDLGGPMPRLH